MQGPQPSELGAEPPSLMVASRAYHLSSALMCILMRSRVLNEEPLTLAGEEIVAQGKRSDPLSLLCQGDASVPGCHFSIPEAFSGALSNLSDVVQLIILVDSNPFPFGYISNYTVSTKVASMAFQTQAGAQIPIGRLASERAITVKVPNNSDQAARGCRTPAGSAVVQPQASVGVVVVPEDNNPDAGLHLQLTYSVLSGGCCGPRPSLCGGPLVSRCLSCPPPPRLVAFRKVCLLLHRLAGAWPQGSGERGNSECCRQQRALQPPSPRLQGGRHRAPGASPRVCELRGAAVQCCPCAPRTLPVPGARALPGCVPALGAAAQRAQLLSQQEDRPGGAGGQGPQALHLLHRPRVSPRPALGAGHRGPTVGANL